MVRKIFQKDKNFVVDKRKKSTRSRASLDNPGYYYDQSNCELPAEQLTKFRAWYEKFDSDL
ncbi:MAG: hypothetical protein KDK90_14570 [Leptospiraceae bacterium]|nr:hypothetical protein [Leptospiraceae bacterium]